MNQHMYSAFMATLPPLFNLRDLEWDANRGYPSQGRGGSSRGRCATAKPSDPPFQHILLNGRTKRPTETNREKDCKMCSTYKGEGKQTGQAWHTEGMGSPMCSIHVGEAHHTS